MAFGDNLNSLAAGLSGLNEAELFNRVNALMLDPWEGFNIRDNRRAFQGVRNGNKIPVWNNEDDYGGFPEVTGCALSECDYDDDPASFTWNIKEIGCKLKLCLKDLADDFRAYFQMYRNMNDTDLTEQAVFLRWVMGRLQRRLNNAQFRLAYLGDADAGSGLFNPFDGYYKLIKANVNSTGRDVSGDVPSASDSGKDWFDYLTELYEKASAYGWFSPENMKFEVPFEVATKVAAHMNMAGIRGAGCDCINPNAAAGNAAFNQSNVRIFGIPVIGVHTTEAAKADKATGTEGDPNIDYNAAWAWLTRIENTPVGFETDGSLNQLDLGYNKEDRYLYINASAMFGVGVPTDAVVAGFGS